MTPRELLRKAAQAFREAGVPDPEVDASLLLAHVTGQQALFLRADAWTQVDEAAVAAFEALCARRLTRQPLQYLLGEQDFYGRTFHVDERVLIPRPETELLAERAVAALKAYAHPAALDLCCGSGCIAATLALECPHASVHGADLSTDALAVTKGNCEALGANVMLHQGNLFDAVPGLTFDLIVSNPPYIPTADCLALQEEVLREPSMALDGGQDGLDFYRRIAGLAPLHLRPGGTLLVEVGFDQAQAVAALFAGAGLRDAAIHEDYQHIGRMVEAHA